MPPGCAKGSMRHAILTPSPWISSLLVMMSPRLIPTRNSMRCVSASRAFLSIIACCNATALTTASTALGNSTRMPSPLILTIRPACALTFGPTTFRNTF